MYVLDTDVFSAIVRGQEEAMSRLLSLEPGEVSVPQPVVAEVRYGLARLSRSRRRAALEKRVEALLRAMPRAEWTDEVSRRFGAVKADLERRGERLEDFDVAIASHGLALDAVVATANVRHYERVTDLRWEDWTTPSRAG
ncbi:MAG: type II toxin-antitoxin system VapC family toxin [Deltaproteobacteria bacterium]|nr:type II toxin-antitoxin system VapC family toxin [Deltaproteobacteria bacterium]